MKVKNKYRTNLIIVIIVVLLLSCIHVRFVFRYVREEIKNYQLRIAEMNIQTLKERLNNDTNQLSVLRDFLEKQKEGFWTTEEAKCLIEEFQNNSNFTRIGVADVEGIMYLTQKLNPIDVSGRNYFKLALEGNISLQSIAENINGREVRRLNIGIPIYKSDIVDGVLIGSYYIDDLHKLLPIGLSDKNIHSFIVRNDGKIIVNGTEAVPYRNLDDIWIMNQRDTKGEEYKIIVDSVSKNKGASITYYMNRERHYMISVPIIFSDKYAHEEEIRWNLLVDIPAYYIVEKASYLLLENMIYTIFLLGLFVVLSIGFYKEKNKEFRIAEKNARKDTVTGGNNRRALEQLFSQMTIEKHQMTIFLIDLDNFKQINDNLGHLEGDEVLVRFSTIVDDMAEYYKGFSGRLGGDEFLLCVPNIGEENAKQLTEELMTQFFSIFGKYKEQYGFGMTIGIAYSPKHGNGLYELIKKADEALYIGKRKGKTMVIFAE